jgi:hypothetical protein
MQTEASHIPYSMEAYELIIMLFIFSEIGIMGGPHWELKFSICKMASLHPLGSVNFNAYSLMKKCTSFHQLGSDNFDVVKAIISYCIHQTARVHV